MTRENKLALIIGFTLVLVVGVLVSDYLSSGDRPALDEMPPAARVRETDRESPDRETFRSNIAQPEAQPQLTAPALVETTPASPAEGVQAVRMNEPAIDASVLGGGLGGGQASRQDDRRPIDAPPLIINQSEIARREEIAREETARQAQTSPATGTRADKVHVVQSGESLYRIAERYLGDGDRWREIQDANPDDVGPDGQVVVGVKLRIPGVPAARAETPAEPARTESARTQPAPTTRSAAERSRTGTKTYVVKPGDTLSEIAQRFLGSGSPSAVRKLIEANKKSLSDANEIRSGMTLVIPAQ